MSVLFGLLSEVYDISPQWYQYALYTVNGYTSYIYKKISSEIMGHFYQKLNSDTQYDNHDTT
jgi:hypothetical protein